MVKKIKNPEDIVKNAEREALRTLSKKSQPKGQKGSSLYHPTKYARKLQRFRKITGRNRISREERRALKTFTASQVKNRKVPGTTAYSRRLLKVYREYEVPEALRDKIAYALQYATPKKTAQMFGLEPIEKEPPAEPPGWKTFTPVDIKTISYSQHPGYMRKGKEIRRTDGYYYVNISLGVLSEKIPIERYFEDFDGGKIDYHGYKDPVDALQLIIDYISPGVLVDPGKSGHLFLVKKDEWDKVKGLSSDYYTSRHYV